MLGLKLIDVTFCNLKYRHKNYWFSDNSIYIYIFSISFCFILHEENNSRIIVLLHRKLFNFIIYVNSFKISIRKICRTMILILTAALFLNFFFQNYLYSINEESELRTNESVACVSRIQMQPNIFPGTDLT